MLDIWALIPVKSLKDSKRRLAHLLPVEQRTGLIQSLLQHELMVLAEVPAITKVLIISSDPSVWRLARQFAAQIEKEPEPQGLNLAVTRGLAVAAENGAAAVLVIPVDLPFITPSDVTTIVNAGMGSEHTLDPLISQPLQQVYGYNGKNGTDRVMAICSDEDEDGTNGLFLKPASDFQFHFGPGSFNFHILEAQKRGITIRTVSTPGLQFDLDNEKDWFAYQRMVSMPNG